MASACPDLIPVRLPSHSRKDKVEEALLLGIEVSADPHLGIPRSLLAGERWQRIGHMRQYIKQVAFLCIDDLLHPGHLFRTDTLLG